MGWAGVQLVVSRGVVVAVMRWCSGRGAVDVTRGWCKVASVVRRWLRNECGLASEAAAVDADVKLE